MDDGFALDLPVADVSHSHFYTRVWNTAPLPICSDLKVGLRVPFPGDDSVKLIPNLRAAVCWITVLRTPAPLPVEPNARNQAKWVNKEIRVLKYVDDAILVKKNYMDTVDIYLGVKKAEESCTVREPLRSYRCYGLMEGHGRQRR